MVEPEFTEVEEMSAFVRQATCDHNDLAQEIGRLFGEIAAAHPNVDMIGPPRLYYTRWDVADCDIEAACPVDRGTSDTKTFPATQAIFTTHTGEYEGLADAWMSLWSYVQAKGLTTTGMCWDEYVVGPEHKPNPSDWVTELYIAVAVPKLS